MVDRRRSPRNFDASKPLVSTRIQKIGGVEHVAGQDIDTSDLTTAQCLRLWLGVRAEYKDTWVHRGKPSSAKSQPKKSKDKAEPAKTEPTPSATTATTSAATAKPKDDAPAKDEPKKKKGFFNKLTGKD